MNDLALCVWNTGSHYNQRVQRYLEQPAEVYKTYLGQLTYAESIGLRKKFGETFTDAQRAEAIEQLYEAMQRHITESCGGVEAWAAGRDAIIYIQSVYGRTMTQREAEAAWYHMSEAQRQATHAAYELYQKPGGDPLPREADVDVIHRDSLDQAARHLFPEDKPWMVQFESAKYELYATEEEACARQREHRKVNGLHEMTGEPV